MSYSLVFSRNPIPKNIDDPWAWIDAEIEKYYKDERGAHPKLKELHDRLTSKYPCICDLSDEELDNGVWSDGPLINNFSQDIAMVAMPFSVVDEVAPFVVETAVNLGIIVFDHQSRNIYGA